ncbi:hypothetical protein A2U01_0028122 [Trifolium medium]|uniref:Uncharacterized protein n=1 Tax=Trifolium medium TaxID=97028 RepID=A0A392P6J4_9FABA|nr:hypothetical protein [Trifolium medium]
MHTKTPMGKNLGRVRVVGWVNFIPREMVNEGGGGGGGGWKRKKTITLQW